MLPEYLELQGFGPYVEKQCIDFKEIGSQHLFLIRGETGSGKTMILDAITYALYGKSSGGQRDTLENMRSRFAKEEDITYLDFRFALNQHHYRFYRSIQIRTTRSGEQVYRIKQDAGEIINGEYFPFFENPKIRLIEDKASELIGLNYEQFHQVMILPQGGFEQFLTSRSEEKQEILKTLFQMDRWGKISSYINDKVRLMNQAIEQLKTEEAMLLKQVNITDINALDELIKEVKEQLIIDKKKLKTQQEIETSLQKERLLVENQQKLQSDLHQYRKQQEMLIHKKVEIDRYQAEVNTYLKLKELEPIVLQMKQTKDTFQIRQKAFQEIQTNFDIAKKELQTITSYKTKEEQAQIDITNLEVTLHEIKRVHDVYQSNDENKKRYDTLNLDIKKEEQQITSLTLRKQEMETVISSLKSQRDILWGNIQEEEGIEDTFIRYTSAKNFYDKKQITQTQLTSLALQKKEFLQKEQTLQKEILRVHNEHEDMYQNFLSSSALQLASELKEHEPCPVCGSIHHPHLASAQSLLVDVTILKAKKEELDTLQQNQLQIKQEIQTNEAQIEQCHILNKQFDDEIHALLNCAFLMQDYTLTQQKQIAHNQYKSKHQAIVKELEQQQCTYDALAKELDKFERHKLSQTGDLQVLKATLEADDKQKLTGIHTLDELIKKESKTQQLLTSTKQALQTLKNEQQRIQSTYDTLHQKIEQAQYEVNESEKNAKVAYTQLTKELNQNALKEDDICLLSKASYFAGLEQQIAEYHTRCLKVYTQIEETEKQCVETNLKNIDDIRLNYEEAKQQTQVLQKQIAEGEATFKQYQKVQKQLHHIREDMEQRQPQYLKMSHFAKSMRGDNSIGIERYVLGVMLSSVTQHANTLLKMVHDGRYQLYRSNDASGRTRKFGLELEIYDAYTCTNRNVVSLSGGEKFLVSLALSLALSMVVQAREGGIRFDALFIDEGFGTLDEHSITDALQILSSMVSTRGIVGIISHVELLKENIPQGIEVIKTRKGSYLKMRKGREHV